VRAIARRRRERVVTVHGKVAVLLERHTPRLVAWLVERGRVSRPEPGRPARPDAPSTPPT
jgi:hypothetical protein